MPSFPRFDLSGKTALVTGGSTGLGLGMARGLAAAGARVMIVGRRPDLLEEAARLLAPEGEVLCAAADLYDRDSVDALAAQAIAALGGVDIFVGNAGAVHAEQLDEISHAETDRALQLNLVSNISLVQAFTPHMKQQRWGRILFSSSTAAALAAPFQGNIVYAAAKAGVNAFARAAAADLGRYGITVNVLILGVFWTSILRNAQQQVRATQGADAAEALVSGFVEMTALGRLGEIEDLAGIVQLLASDAGGYITGAGIPLDGGTGIMMRPLDLVP